MEDQSNSASLSGALHAVKALQAQLVDYKGIVEAFEESASSNGLLVDSSLELVSTLEKVNQDIKDLDGDFRELIITYKDQVPKHESIKEALSNLDTELAKMLADLKTKHELLQYLHDYIVKTKRELHAIGEIHSKHLSQGACIEKEVAEIKSHTLALAKAIELAGDELAKLRIEASQMLTSRFEEAAQHAVRSFDEYIISESRQSDKERTDIQNQLNAHASILVQISHAGRHIRYIIYSILLTSLLIIVILILGGRLGDSRVLGIQSSKVQVLNGAGIPGAASQVSTFLREQQIQIGYVGDAPTASWVSTEVFFHNSTAEAAEALAEKLGLAPERVHPGPSAPGREDITVVLGSDYSSLRPFSAGNPTRN